MYDVPGYVGENSSPVLFLPLYLLLLMVKVHSLSFPMAWPSITPMAVYLSRERRSFCGTSQEYYRQE